MAKPYSPYTGVVVYIHESIGENIGLRAELDKVLLFDPYISDVYISLGSPYQAQVKNWCEQHQINWVMGANYIDSGAKNHRNRIVLYLGQRRNTTEFKLASDKAKQLGVDLFVLP